MIEFFNIWMTPIIQVSSLGVLVMILVKMPTWIRELMVELEKEREVLKRQAEEDRLKMLQMVREDMNRCRSDFISHNRVVECVLKDISGTFLKMMNAIKREVRSIDLLDD